MKFAVIGAFWLSENFIKAIKMTSGAEYYAQYSRDIEKARDFAEKNGGAKCYDDLCAMSRDREIDAVYIASPNMTHYAYSKLFIEAGKHVLCEKPICINTDEFGELCALADKKGVIYAEAMMNYHLPQLQKIKEKLPEAGDVVSARLDFSQRSSKLERVKKGERVSTFDKESCGGALLDLGVYPIYLSVSLFGYPGKISAHARFYESGVDITDTVVLSYADFDAVLTFSKLAESAIRSEIICRDGTFKIGQCAQMRNTEFVDILGNSYPLCDAMLPEECMSFELSDFISYIDKKGDYLEARKTAREVISITCEIRRQIGYEVFSK